jgi:hypothetical protein
MCDLSFSKHPNPAPIPPEIETRSPPDHRPIMERTIKDMLSLSRIGGKVKANIPTILFI